MNLETLKLALKTKTARLILLFGAIYLAFLPIYTTFIFPGVDIHPEGIQTFFRDLIWVIYWRYPLDWLIIFAFVGITTLHLTVFKKLLTKIPERTLAMYVLPIYIMAANYLSMLAIDIAVTYFADVFIAGNWESTEIVFLGRSAQEIYHGFFFWFAPLLIIETFVVMTFLREKRYLPALKVFFLCMGLYSITLGFLDPVVCHYLWGDWRIFGEWDMGGLGAIFAEGWILHYVLLGMLWFFAIKFIDLMVKEMLVLENAQKTEL